MRVLILHSRYLSGDSSGENRVVEDEAQLLSASGHDVRLLSLSPKVDRLRDRVSTAATVVIGGHVNTLVAAEVRRFSPDVVHVHNMIPALSPAVLGRSTGRAKVVATLHNFRLLCLAGTLLRDGVVCETCVGRHLGAGIRHRCYRGSTTGSAVVATALHVHRACDTFSNVDRFLAVSEFVKRKHVEAGFEPSTIGIRPNFSWPVERRSGAGEYFLYVGRLSPEKGVVELVRDWPADAALVVVGAGPSEHAVRCYAGPNVSVVGAVSGADVSRYVARASALVVPSRCYEGMPRVIVEAFASGVPVIANRTGGLPELIRNGETGLLINTAQVTELVGAVDALSRPDENVSIGEAAHAEWMARYSPQASAAHLETVYKDVLAGD